jgi:hypothetical protein
MSKWAYPVKQEVASLLDRNVFPSLAVIGLIEAQALEHGKRTRLDGTATVPGRAVLAKSETRCQSHEEFAHPVAIGGVHLIMPGE